MMYRDRSTGGGVDGRPSGSTGAHASKTMARTTDTATMRPRCLVISIPPEPADPDRARGTVPLWAIWATFDAAARAPDLGSAPARGAPDVGEPADAGRVQRGDGVGRRRGRLRVLVRGLPQPRHRAGEPRPGRHRRARPGAGVVAD